MSKVNPRLAYWIGVLYDHKELTDAGRAVLIYLATRMLDFETGTGYCSITSLAGRLGKGESTVRRALDLGERAKVIEQTRQGRRLGDNTTVASEWKIHYPPLPQPVSSERLRDVSIVHPLTVEDVSTARPLAVEDVSTARKQRLNRSETASQPPASERPSGSESPSEHLSSLALAELRGAGHHDVTGKETETILRNLKNNGARDPLAVLRSVISRGRAGEYVDQARADLNDRAAGRAASSSEAARHPSARTARQAIADAPPQFADSARPS